ncbi:MAG: bifunctional diaminohydroxyphosphoribosylaminopyrimidine deaminase/5-amino-6-(5-phosphoribosylamino)uracil reductase RibD [Pseudomonadota bacterium]
MTEVTEIDRALMREAVDFSRQNLGQTGSNPSVGTVIVREGLVVGRGVTAIGGRPHAEAQALAEAGDAARGATAYVTLEPCAHHGRTPPCAVALAKAGISRVVCALSDPDDRVAGRGFQILRHAGIEVITDIEADYARTVLWAYLVRSEHKRSGVTLKLAVSADGMLGISGHGSVPITGEETRKAVHQFRAEHDVIMVGIGTVLADDPMLDVRIDAIEHRSPHRVIVDRTARLPLGSRIVSSAHTIQTSVASCEPTGDRAKKLTAAGVNIIACAEYEGEVALPELLEDLGSTGIQSVFLEGGAKLARSFLEEDLVDQLQLFRSDKVIGVEGVGSPSVPENVSSRFKLREKIQYGSDMLFSYERK